MTIAAAHLALCRCGHYAVYHALAGRGQKRYRGQCSVATPQPCGCTRFEAGEAS